MRLDELKEKALSLPLSPGVYIMKDQARNVIYVGKAKKLKNRVSQYFQDTASHSVKTLAMVDKVDDFDVIVASSEFEALILECSLIKQHQPKYNILLKDDKGYPFLRIDFSKQYPVISMVGHASEDGASYFGPFGSRHVTQELIKAVKVALKLPDCNKNFPVTATNNRPCLNYHMGQCEGWCQTDKTQQAYYTAMLQAKRLLSGDYKSAAEEIKKQMLLAAGDMNFELAASLRDKMQAVEILGKKQRVTAITSVDTDVIGYVQLASKSCFTVLHFCNGNLVDKYHTILPATDNEAATVSSLLKQYYLSRSFAPRVILLPFCVEDGDVFAQLLSQQQGRKVTLRVPQRGDGIKLVSMAMKNAQEEVERATDKEARISSSLAKLGAMLAIDPPSRIESFDISNVAGTDIVAGMVVFTDGKPNPSEYKKFKIDELDGQDDYAAMAIALRRRFNRYLNGDADFAQKPDLLLIDGGITHAVTAQNVLRELNVDVLILGMVKDDRHRTRALVTPDGSEISIVVQQPVFSLIGNIQEETHRYAIGYHKKLRTKRLRYSELDKIPGIGVKRKQELLKTFKSISAIRGAGISELERVLPKNTATAVYDYFHNRQKGE